LIYPDLPNTLLSNHDYHIAHRSFFFDLSPWEDETPNDDRSQPLGTGGFTPWYVKYCSSKLAQCKQGAVETEWKLAELISA